MKGLGAVNLVSIRRITRDGSFLAVAVPYVWGAACIIDAVGLVIIFAGACALQAISPDANLGLLFWAWLFHLMTFASALTFWRTASVEGRRTARPLVATFGAMSIVILMVACDSAVSFAKQVCQWWAPGTTLGPAVWSRDCC
jgi:hypothetical protein